MSFFSSILDPMPNLWFKLCLYLYSNCQSYFCHNQLLRLILSIIMFIYEKCLLHTLTYAYITHFVFWTKNITWTYVEKLGNCDFYAKVVSKIDIAHKFITKNYEDWRVSLKKKKRVLIKFSRHQVLYHYLFLSNATMYCLIWRSELKEWDRGIRHHIVGKSISSLSLEMWWTWRVCVGRKSQWEC